MNNISRVRIGRRLAFIACCALVLAVEGNHANAQGLPRCTAVLDLTIDGEEADLVPVRSIAVDSRGFMYAVQTKDFNLAVFSPDGTRARTIGRKGDGPGEFRSLQLAGIVSDTLWTIDAANSRITWFTLEGRRLRSTNFAMVHSDTIRMSPTPRAVRSDGSLLAHVSSSRTGKQYEVHVNSKGEILHTLSTRTLESGGLTFSNYEGGKWFPDVESNPPIVSAAQDGSRFVIATAELSGENAGTGLVTVLNYLCDTLFTRRYPIVLKPIPAATYESTIAEFARKFPSSVERVRSLPRAQFYPPLEYLRVGRDGSVLLAFYTDGLERDFFFINSSGDIEASLTLPSDVVIRTFDREYLWGLKTDADDLESIVRFRLQK